jgi:hypothetical protein
MLNQPAPFPYVGSFALFEDDDGETHLVRIQAKRPERNGATERVFAMISFPLRDGASGNKVVAFDQLQDGTPLTRLEQREFHDLDRALAGRSLRTAKQKAAKARRDALRARILAEPIMARLVREADAKAARQRKAA